MRSITVCVSGLFKTEQRRAMQNPSRKPVVLLPACRQSSAERDSHVVGHEYIMAVRLAGATPLIVANALADELSDLLDLADGVLLTGSPSNVEPSHFGEAVRDPSLPLDADRDAWTLPLIPAVIARGMPLLAICRGAQEVNVALGGSLHQAVHELGPYLDHREVADQPVDIQYGPAHEVVRADGGQLATIGLPARFSVNSLHGQAVNRLAASLRVEATAPDGLIEAFSVPGAPGFNLCVQWHPEWQAASNAISIQLLQAFGQACCAYRDRDRNRDQAVR